MRITGQLKLIKINERNWKSATSKVLNQAVKDSATVWINASILSRVPAWSGASWATAKKLAKAVNYSFTIPTPAKLHPRAKGVQAGFAASKGFVSKDAAKLQYSFTYATDLWHLVYNEYKNANANKVEDKVFSHLQSPGPYNFQQMGISAFNSFVQNVRLPNPWDYITLKARTLG